ncbi:hypothetical protein RSSM_00208 [Rhodopirellula sallentina SM41]|uniref:Uncharacterized protein n=1 Tax=Rhodopirellula sallentina SM41 TaxID=1263870 RepID=M5UQT7_9BACT|nr:hypothetical protein RSSM_00208 [Rhodopirellula sallentina SM41]
MAQRESGRSVPARRQFQSVIENADANIDIGTRFPNRASDCFLSVRDHRRATCAGGTVITGTSKKLRVFPSREVGPGRTVSSVGKTRSRPWGRFVRSGGGCAGLKWGSLGSEG